MQMQEKAAKECENKVTTFITIVTRKSSVQMFSCSFSDTMCGTDAWRKGEGQKIVGFSLYEVSLL